MSTVLRYNDYIGQADNSSVLNNGYENAMSKLIEKFIAQYKDGIDLLKERGYYHSLLSEIYYLIIYLDSQNITQLLSDNLFSDIQGVFSVYIRDDLRRIYEDLQESHHISFDKYLNKPSTNLIVLHRCTTNLEYQVKSIVRMPQIKNYALKSRYLESVSRKLSGEIQAYYKVLAENYKKYFRGKFSNIKSANGTVSLDCLKQLCRDYDNSFAVIARKFLQLSMALHFVEDLFRKELELKIRHQIQPVFQNRKKLDKLIHYFINDLKRTLIQMVIKQTVKGRSFEWIESGLREFLEGERFQKLLKKVILHTFSVMQKNTRKPEITESYFF
ncbi:MAG: hypothetical protein EH225_02890 [Calditrichaeota bacterium]|nr:MAG: hypothetical protein EH225_02890 [Calditrichota bacterium]